MARGIDTLYTQDGEKVTISKIEGGGVKLSVGDEEIGIAESDAGSKFCVKKHTGIVFSDLDNFPLQSEYGMSIIRVIISNFDGIVIENSSTTGNYVSQLYISSDGLKFRKRQDKKVYDPWITIV